MLHDQQGTPLGYVQSGTAYAYATDNIGSVTNVVASNGTTEATYAYDPYGHMNSATGTDAAQNLIRYAGGLYDTASNYWHFGARWYNPTADFFTTQDTSSYLDNPANGNRYAYASDNPANYIDPSGQCSLIGCVETIVGYTIGGAVTGGTIGGAVGCIVAGAMFDPPGCAAAWAGGAAIGGSFGAIAGLGFGVGVVAAEEYYGS